MGKNRQKDIISAENSNQGKTFRRMTAMASAGDTDNLAVMNSELNASINAIKDKESQGVQDREESVPTAIKAACVILDILALFLFFVPYFATGKSIWLIACGVCIAGRIGIAIWKHNRDQKAWIARLKQ